VQSLAMGVGSKIRCGGPSIELNKGASRLVMMRRVPEGSGREMVFWYQTGRHRTSVDRFLLINPLLRTSNIVWA